MAEGKAQTLPEAGLEGLSRDVCVPGLGALSRGASVSGNQVYHHELVGVSVAHTHISQFWRVEVQDGGVSRLLLQGSVP